MSQDPMPLDPELLEMENELRALVPLELDFPTAQRLTRALELELNGAVAPGGWGVIEGGVQKPPAPPAHGSARRGRSLSEWWPWAAAACMVVAGVSWISLSQRSATAGLRDADSSTSPPARGSVEQVFPKHAAGASFDFGPSGTELEALVTDLQAPQPARRATIPEATSPYGFLDVTFFELSGEYCREVGLPGGVCVTAMGAAGPAARQGIWVRDCILKVDGQPVTTAAGFAELIRNASPGTELRLTVLRGTMIGEIAVRLGSAPSA